jgi:hypothetical protein
MIRKIDPELVTARKTAATIKEPDIAEAPEHKQWVNALGKADLPARIHRDQAEVEKAVEKAGLVYSTKELAALSPLAPTPVKHDVVLFTRKGKVVGYSVGATPVNSAR